jgi:hypothetical protein
MGAGDGLAVCDVRQRGGSVRIVGICSAGPWSSGTGKSLVAKRIVKAHSFVEVAISDPMKRFVGELFGWDEDFLWGSDEKRNAPDDRFKRMRNVSTGANSSTLSTFYGPVPVGLSPREALQELGTQWGRGCYENVWIDYALRAARFVLEEPGGSYERRVGAVRATKFSDDGKRVELDESEMVAGVVIPDVRFWNEARGIHDAGGAVIGVRRDNTRPLDGLAGLHPSETGLLGFEPDFLIENNGTLEALHEQVDAAMAKWLERGW